MFVLSLLEGVGEGSILCYGAAWRRAALLFSYSNCCPLIRWALLRVRGREISLPWETLDLRGVWRLQQAPDPSSYASEVTETGKLP